MCQPKELAELAPCHSARLQEDVCAGAWAMSLSDPASICKKCFFVYMHSKTYGLMG